MDIESRSSFLVSGKSERVDSPEWICLNGANKLGPVHQVEANANFPKVYGVTWRKNHQHRQQKYVKTISLSFHVILSA